VTVPLPSPGGDVPAPIARRRASTLDALRHRDFRLLWAGLLTSGAGDSMQLFAIGWLVVQLADRDGVPQRAPLYIGLVGLSRSVPAIAFSLFGGVFADRMDRRKLLAAAQSTGALLAVVLAVLTLTDRISLPSVMLISALGAAAFGFDRPTRQAMLPRIVPPSDLLSAIGLNAASLNGSALLGPLIGGLLIGPIGIGGLMILNAVSYGATLTALALMRPIPILERPRGNVFRSLGDGLTHVARDPVLRWVIVLSAVLSLGARPFEQLLPAVTKETLGAGPVQLSWLLVAYAVGMLAGSVIGGSMGGTPWRGRILIGAVVGMGATLVLFSVQRSLLPAALLASLPGFNHFTFSVMAYSILQTRPPDHFRGRVVSVYSMTVQGMMPLGTLLLGSLGSAIGVNSAIAAGGSAVAVIGLYALSRAHALRRFGTIPADAAPAAP
jgi:MFS family permease